MAVKIYWLHTFSANNKIGIMPRPRGGEWLNDELKSLRKQDADILVSLLESDEIIELGLREEAALCKQNGLEFISFPIADRCIPPKSIKTSQFISLLSDQINNGKNLVIHCRMGIGRSSIVAGAVIIAMGINSIGLIQIMSSIRGLKVPDTIEQEKWLMQQRGNNNNQ